MVLEQLRFDFFWNLYQAALPKYVFHKWKYLVLGENITTDVRQASLKKGEVGKCLTKNIESTLVGNLCDIKKIESNIKNIRNQYLKKISNP